MSQFRCSCGKQLSVPATVRSSQIRCPGCGGVFSNPNTIQESAGFLESLPPAGQSYGSSEYWNTQPQTARLPPGLLVAAVAIGTGTLLLGLLLALGTWFLRSSNLSLLAVPDQSTIAQNDVPELGVTLGKFRACGVPTTFAELDAAYRSQLKQDKTAEWSRLLAEVENLDLKDRSQFLTNNEYGHLVMKIEPGMKFFLDRLLQRYQRVLESTQELTDSPFSARYPLHAQPSEADKIPEIRNAEKLARLLLYDAYRQSFSGDQTTAIRRLVASMRVAATIEPYPNDIAQIFRYSIVSNATDAVVSILERKEVDDAQLAELDHEYRRVLLSNSAKSCLAGNLVVGLTGYEDSQGTLRYLEGVSLEKTDVYQSVKLDDLEAERAYYAARMFQRLEAVNDRAKLNQLESDERLEVNTGSFLLAKLSMNPLDKSRDFRYATWHSAETARTVIAIERFRRAANSFPSSLQQLVPKHLDSVPVDHFSGSPLRYEPIADGYSLFSSAENAVAKDDSWQYFPPLKLRTSLRKSVPTSGAQAREQSDLSTPPPFPSYWSNSTPIDATEKMIRDAEQEARANANVSRRMQQEHDAAKPPRQ